MQSGHKWQFNIGYHYARARTEVLPQLPRVYNYEQCRTAENNIMLNFVFHFVEEKKTLTCFCRLPVPLLVVAITSSVVQLLVKPDISQHPPQLPLRPNVQTLRYLNFGPRQILVIAIRGTFAFWHADISSFQRKLALSAWDQNLRRENG